MSTQPSEHAMRAANWITYHSVWTDEAYAELRNDAAKVIDTHAIEPATRELREALARIQGLTMGQVRDAAEGFQLCREIAARALSENEEKK
jgi:hypothetical protein